MSAEFIPPRRCRRASTDARRTPTPPPSMDGADPAMMEKLMAALGKSGEGGEGGMDDIASMMANMGGMGGSPEQQAAQKNHADLAAKNAGEVEGGADGKKYKCVAGGCPNLCSTPHLSHRLATSHETHCLRSSADMSRPARTASRRSSFASPCKRPRPRRTSRSSSRPPRCRSPSMVCRRRTRRAVRGLVSGTGAAKLRDQTLTPSLS